MMQRKNISIFISSIVISALLLCPVQASAQYAKKKKIVLEPDTVPLFNGFAVSFDLLGPLTKVISDYGQIEGALRINLRDRYFPIVELGIGLSDHTDDATQIHYKNRAPYGRLGVDFNLMKNKHDIYRLYAGFRYGFTSFKYDIESPGLHDPVWEDDVPFRADGVKANYHWIEGVAGVDATIWGPVHLGWSVRYRNRLFYDEGTLDRCWYVPGYGKSGKSVFGGTFNLIIDI